MEQWREGAVVQVYHPRYRGRIGKVVGREGNNLVVMIDGRKVKVDPSKAVLVKAVSESNEHRGTASGAGAKIA